VHALGVGPAILGDPEAIADADALDHQDTILDLDLTDRLNVVAVRIDFDLARFQRAGEGAGQSPASRGHDIVKRGRVRRILPGLHAVVLGHL
jgi:hypothetical protein